MNRNNRSRRTNHLAATGMTAGRFLARETACRSVSMKPDTRCRSHYAAAGVASLPRRSGRRY